MSDIKKVNIMSDIKEYVSPITGEVISTRSKHKEHLKSHDLVETHGEREFLEKRRAEVLRDNEKKMFNGLGYEIRRQLYGE